MPVEALLESGSQDYQLMSELASQTLASAMRRPLQEMTPKDQEDLSKAVETVIREARQGYDKRAASETTLAPKFLALAREQLAVTQKNLATVKASLKDLAAKKRRSEEVKKGGEEAVKWEDLGRRKEKGIGRGHDGDSS